MVTVALPTRTTPRKVDLNPREYLMVACHEDYVECSYYRLRRPDEDSSLPAKRRFANRRRTLELVIAAVFHEGEAPHSADTVAAYIRATAWGERMP